MRGNLYNFINFSFPAGRSTKHLVDQLLAYDIALTGKSHMIQTNMVMFWRLSENSSHVVRRVFKFLLQIYKFTMLISFKT